jgi:hypothetical protein
MIEVVKFKYPPRMTFEEDIILEALNFSQKGILSAYDPYKFTNLNPPLSRLSSRSTTNLYWMGVM